MNTDAARKPALEINSEQAFTVDPVFRLMSIFEDSDAGVAAVQELKENGFDENDIEMFCGVPGEQTYDFSGDGHGLMAKFMRKFRNITFDRIIMDRYQKALHDEHCILMLRMQQSARKAEAAEILRRHGATQVDYFGLAATQSLQHNDDADVYDPDATF